MLKIYSMNTAMEIEASRTHAGTAEIAPSNPDVVLEFTPSQLRKLAQAAIEMADQLDNQLKD